MPEHRQVLLRAGHQTAEVDEGIAPLIEQVWLADIETTLSCEENKPGIAWIDFESPQDARRFLNIVARFERKSDSLYHRVLRCDGYPFPAWTYDIHPWDVSLIGDDDREAHLGRSDFHFSVSIRFPRSDIPVLLDLLKTYNARRSATSMSGTNDSQAEKSRAVVRPSRCRE